MTADAVRQIIPGTNEEIWVSTIEGTIHVTKTNWDGKPVPAKTKGKGDTLKITERDRIAVQERIRDPKSDPFTNGRLVRKDADQQADPTTKSSQALTDDELALIFTLDEADFQEQVNGLNEVNVRRLVQITKDESSTAAVTSKQERYLDAVIKEKFAVGGSTPTWDEMQADQQTGKRG